MRRLRRTSLSSGSLQSAMAACSTAERVRPTSWVRTMGSPLRSRLWHRSTTRCARSSRHLIRVLLVEPGARRTGTSTTARKFRDDVLSANFQAEQRYRAALTAMDGAFEKAGADESEVTVRAIMQALTAPTEGTGRGGQ